MILVASYLVTEKPQNTETDEVCGEVSLSRILYSADGEIHICMMHVWAYEFRYVSNHLRGVMTRVDPLQF